jgi:hypothetical protein
MGFLNSSTPEEKLAARVAKDEAAAAKAEAKAEERFWASMTGQARLAYHRGDELFQLAMPLRQQHAVIAPMVGAAARSRDSDWSAELSTVIREGWEIVSASTVFVETGSESRDKFMASGQQIAVSGEVVGYYLFRRNGDNLVPD